MRINLKTIFVLAGGVALAAPPGVIALLRSNSEHHPEPMRPAVVRPIPTAIVEASRTCCTRVFPGTVRAARRVELAFSVPGLLDQLHAAEGHNVRQGEMLARLDQRDYQYELDMAKAKFENANRELARYTDLRKQRVATEVEYESALTAHSIALAQLHVRQKALQDTVLYAPFDGVVARRHIENNEHVQAKQPIVSFQDISRVQVVIQVPERLIAHGGTDALHGIQVCFDADDTRWFDAVVRENSVTSDKVTQTYDVVVELAPPSDLKVFPGMTATVRAEIPLVPCPSQPSEGTTRVPAEALCRSNDGAPYVWIINPTGGMPTRRLVESAGLCGDQAEVRSGLRPGEHVAIAALHLLREDTPVRPVLDNKEGLDG